MSRPIAHGVARRQHEDRQARVREADPATDVEPRDVGQADVEDDRVGAAAVERQIEAIASVRGDVHHVSVTPQEPREGAGEARVVFDDEHVQR
jgi:hypothetical protein